jgi:beta-1,4-N-acetylglucosaminyltransferase
MTQVLNHNKNKVKNGNFGCLVTLDCVFCCKTSFFVGVAWWMIAIVFVVLGLIAVRLFLVWPRLGKRRVARGKRCVKTMVVLGSGGHTSELLPVVMNLDRSVYSPRIYVVADARSSDKASAWEQTSKDFEICSIPRAREVGQSYVTSVATTLHALVHSVWLVLSRRPELILCNGPGICIPIAVAALIFRFFSGTKACSVVFIESGCRVEKVAVSFVVCFQN